MDLREAMRARHAVRAYTEQPLDVPAADALRETLARCSHDGGLRMRLVTDEPHAFGNRLVSGMFSNVRNYVGIASHRNPGWEERCGYYGAQVMLRATQLGFDTCFVAQTFSRRRVAEHMRLTHGEEVRFAIAVGYGRSHGTAHRSKSFGQVAAAAGGIVIPEWFERGVQAALLAPTALNQQRFTFTLDADGRTVHANPGIGPCVRTDLGCAKRFFEIGAQPHTPVRWA